MSAYLAWLRQHVGPHLVPLVYATAVVRDDRGRILFQRRADFDWWGLPGGVLEPGETPVACLQREVLEEAGLRVEVVRLTGVYSSPRYNVVYPNGDRVQQVTFCYDCRIAEGSPQPDGGEILELGFFSDVELPPHPRWYADMVEHAVHREILAGPYFDPPEQVEVETPFPTLMAVRRVVGSAPLVWAGANAAVLDEAGRILLVRRADDGSWGLPAGALNVGETLAHTVLRETLEETGLRVEPMRPVGVYAGDEFVYPNGDRVFPVGLVFLCRATGGQLWADGHESTEVGFFNRAGLPPLPSSMRARVLAALAGEAGPQAL